MSCCQTQVRPILHYIHKIHLGLRDQLDDLIEKTLAPRSQLIAEYLLKQEKLLEEALHQSMKGADAGTLDAFVDAKFNLDSENVLEKAILPAAPGVDDLTGPFFIARDSIIEILKESARSASDRKAKELLLSLWKLEENERNLIARSVMQLDDM